jgi:adhesin transport system membrane fusion protein
MLNISQKSVAKPIHDQHLHALEVLHNNHSCILLANVILIILAICLVVLFMPWTQTVDGYGEVTALNPSQRPQSLQNAIPGQIESWLRQEGQFVRKGDTILTIREVKDDYFDPNILTRYQEQLDAQYQSIEATQQKIIAYQQQIVALQQNQEYSNQKAFNKINQARLKVTADSADLVNARNEFQTAIVRFDRFKSMFQDGLISRTDFENRQLKFVETENKVRSAEAKLDVARQEFQNAVVEYNSVGPDYAEKIAKATSDLNASRKDLAEAESKLSQLRNKTASIAIRRSYYAITAPQDAYLVRTSKAGIGENIKEGETIAVLQPALPSQAVAVYVRALDVPLLKPGRKVRIEFEGWPSLQWAAGWPGANIGTFGGIVRVIDFTDSKDGKFRVLVVPDPSDDAWPAQLRLGSQAYGWIMLNDVPVWYEIWRQINNFPPKMPVTTEEKQPSKPKGK